MTSEKSSRWFTIQNWKELRCKQWTMQTAVLLFTMQNWKESDVSNDNEDSSRLFKMQNWKESDVSNDNEYSLRLFKMQNWKESDVNNNNADKSSRLFTMPN